MKFLVLFILTLACQTGFAETKGKSSESATCVDESGNPKVDSHCICYLKKTVCSDGVGSCAEHVCEEVACSQNKDCSAMSGKCVDGFCKK
jgi:hypothetical protein